MIGILITIKPSVRFPHKNELLAPYTIEWLKGEDLTDCVVYSVGDRTEFPQVYNHIECSTGSHRGDIEYAVNQLPWCDYFVLLQVTQPIRRKGLLADAKAMLTENKVVISATSMDSWRCLSLDGQWNTKGDEQSYFIDGALYGFHRSKVAEVFDNTAPHCIVLNKKSLLVDIDYPQDYEDFASWTLQG